MGLREIFSRNSMSSSRTVKPMASRQSARWMCSLVRHLLSLRLWWKWLLGTRVKIRFLEVTESAAPGYPFRPGQVVDYPASPELARWLNEKRAVPVDDETEQAVAPPQRKRGRPRHETAAIA